jgi:RTX calcium-binding nonapeptide repeat (4 copies)
MLFKGTNSDDILQGTNGNDTLKGNAGNDFIFSNDGDDLVSGGDGIDFLYGSGQGEAYFTTGGSDTLTGGKGQDAYYISLDNGGGSVIKGGSTDLGVSIVAENIDLDAFYSIYQDLPDIASGDLGANVNVLTTIADPDIWGEAAIELSRPEEGIVGLEKSGTSLIIDISRDGVADASDDLTITNYFDDQGNLGTGAPLFVNNIIDRQDIVDFFA